MATANFRTMENFPLFILDNTDDDFDFTYGEINDSLSDINHNLNFHQIVIESGYYCGIQFYVEENHNPNELDNEDCKYYFDMYRSVAIGRYDSEINKICKILQRLAAMYGFKKMYCSGRFSNGEAVYTPVSKNNNRSRVLQAVLY